MPTYLNIGNHNAGSQNITFSQQEQSAYDTLRANVASNVAALNAARQFEVPGTPGYDLGHTYYVFSLAHETAPSPTTWTALRNARSDLMDWITASFPQAHQGLAVRALGVSDMPAYPQASPAQQAPDQSITPPDLSTAAGVQAVTVEQARQITAAQLRDMGDRVQYLSHEVLESLVPEQISGIRLSALTVDQLRIFSTSQLFRVTHAQITELNTRSASAPTLTPAEIDKDIAERTEKLQALLGSEIAALNVEAVPALMLERLNSTQLAGFIDRQMGAVTATQMNALRAERWPELGKNVTFLKADVYPLLSRDKVSGMSASQIAMFDKAGSVPTAGSTGHASALVSLSEDALRDLLASSGKAAALTPEVLSLLISHPTKKSLLLDSSVVTVTPASSGTPRTSQSILASIPSATISRLSALNIAAVGLNALTVNQCSALKANQLGELGAAAARAGTSDSTFADKLSGLGAEVSGLSPSFLGALTVTQANSFTDAQITALSVKVMHLSAGVLDAWFRDSSKASKITPSGIEGLIILNRPRFVNAAGGATAALTGLPTATIAGLSSGWLNTLGLKVLSNAQLGALTASQLSTLDRGAVTGMSGEQLRAVGGNIQHFSAAALGSLDIPQAQALSTTQINALNMKAVELFSDDVISAAFLNTEPRQESLTSGAAQYLLINKIVLLWEDNATQRGAEPARKNLLERFTIGQIDKLTKADLETLAGYQVKHLARLRPGPPEVLNFRPDQIPGVQLSALDRGYLEKMTLAQIGQITGPQIVAFSGDQISYLGTNITALTDVALGQLSVADAEKITRPQAEALRDQGRLGAVSAAVAAKFFERFGASFVPQDLNKRHPSWIEDSDITGLTPQTIASWSPQSIARLGARIGLLSLRAVAALTPAQMAEVELKWFSPRQLSELQPAQLQGLTQPKQVQGLSSRQFDSLRSKLVYLPDPIIPGIDVSVLSNGVFRRLAAAKTGAFSVDQIRSLSPDQIRMTGRAIANLSPQALAALTPEQVQKMSSDQVVALDGNLGHLTLEAFEALCSERRRVRSITARGAQSLSADHIAVAPLHLFTADALRPLTSAQLADVTPGQLLRLNASQRAILGLETST